MWCTSGTLSTGGSCHQLAGRPTLSRGSSPASALDVLDRVTTLRLAPRRAGGPRSAANANACCRDTAPARGARQRTGAEQRGGAAMKAATSRGACTAAARSLHPPATTSSVGSTDAARRPVAMQIRRAVRESEGPAPRPRSTARNVAIAPPPCHHLKPGSTSSRTNLSHPKHEFRTVSNVRRRPRAPSPRGAAIGSRRNLGFCGGPVRGVPSSFTFANSEGTPCSNLEVAPALIKL